jgi:ABC-type antimicrobial peptide transport system permease subunit
MRGSEFTEHDQRVSPTSGAIQNAIVNESAAREFFGTDDPIGRRITADQSMVIDATGVYGDQPLATSSERTSYTIIGVVHDVKTGFMTAKAVPAVYVPLSVEDYRRAPVSGTTVVFRGDAGPDAISSVRGELAAIDPNLTIFNVRSMREQLDEMFSLIVFSEAIYGGIGVFGLILASIGLAGVTGYAVARRRKEIGIRMALGARSAQVLRLVLKEGTALVAVGSVFGFIGAFAISRGLSSITSQFAQAFASSTGDPVLLIGAPLLLAALAMLACYVPARKSTKIDPLAALREE